MMKLPFLAFSFRRNPVAWPHKVPGRLLTMSEQMREKDKRVNQKITQLRKVQKEKTPVVNIDTTSCLDLSRKPNERPLKPLGEENIEQVVLNRLSETTLSQTQNERVQTSAIQSIVTSISEANGRCHSANVRRVKTYNTCLHMLMGSYAPDTFLEIVRKEVLAGKIECCPNRISSPKVLYLLTSRAESDLIYRHNRNDILRDLRQPVMNIMPLGSSRT